MTTVAARHIHSNDAASRQPLTCDRGLPQHPPRCSGMPGAWLPFVGPGGGLEVPPRALRVYVVRHEGADIQASRRYPGADGLPRRQQSPHAGCRPRIAIRRSLSQGRSCCEAMYGIDILRGAQQLSLGRINFHSPAGNQPVACSPHARCKAA